jgi:serine/threonine-protein kinase RsbW
VVTHQDQIEVAICDEGSGFDQAKLQDPRQEDNLQKPNGRGIFLIREFSNDVSFNEKGNQITFTIHRQTTCPMLQSTNKS